MGKEKAQPSISPRAPQRPCQTPAQLKKCIPSLAGWVIELLLPFKTKCCRKNSKHHSSGPRTPGLAEALGSVALSLPLACSGGLTQRTKETVCV